MKLNLWPFIAIIMFLCAILNLVTQHWLSMFLDLTCVFLATYISIKRTGR